MTGVMKSGRKACSVTGGMVISATVSIAITLFLSLWIANLLNHESITWEQAGYWIMGMLFAASFLGGKSAIAAIQRQKLLIAIMSGALYWGILLCMTALFFGGNFDSLWETAGIISAGCTSAALIALPGRQKQGRKTAKSIVKLNKKII